MTPRLSRIDTIALVVGAIIGWGSFVLPGTRFLSGSGVIDTAIGFAIGGIAVMFIQRGYHHMFERHVDHGGEAAYAARFLGRGHGFIVGWALMLTYTSIVALNGVAFVLVIKLVAGDAVSQVYLYTVAGYPVYLTDIAIASATMVFFAWLNLRGLKVSSRTENVLVSSLLINVAILFVLMLVLGDTDQFVATYVDGWQINWAHVASVVAIVPFLFVGFDVIAQVARDLAYPPHRATRLAVIGIVIGCVLYAGMNTLTALAFTPAQAAEHDWATGAAVTEYVGPVGFVLLVVALVGAVLGGISAFTLAASSLIASLASNRFLPLSLAHTDDRHVLNRAVLLILGVSLIAPWAGREAVNYIVDMSSLLAAIAYAYTCFISIRIGNVTLERVYAAVGLACSVGFIALLLWPGSPGQLSGPAMGALVVWAAMGLVVFARGRHHPDAPEIGERLWVAPQGASSLAAVVTE
ncbi:APC family permease [Demequina muriae]|uniref:APC family permease n=1 Tax=Demequina muriae TaxID=3051664 RepID=A0ABT8GEF0_9MICO|nr:APC family permease [Demequina sp. EGI L300058]MDN4479802.1 APC family permease [Demequina sp. EGI L300058]